METKTSKVELIKCLWYRDAESDSRSGDWNLFVVSPHGDTPSDQSAYLQDCELGMAELGYGQPQTRWTVAALPRPEA
jgi:hypothetical protein